MNPKDTPLAELTVDELQSLIHVTVQQAMAEVMIEMAITAEVDAEISEQAEMTSFLRSYLRDRSTGGIPIPDLYGRLELDD